MCAANIIILRGWKKSHYFSFKVIKTKQKVALCDLFQNENFNINQQIAGIKSIFGTFFIPER